MTELGATFKKQLSVSDSNLGDDIKDAVVSPLYSSIYDGEISMFPQFELTSANTNLEKGQVPVGSTYASTYYLLEFPAIRTPTYGSAELYSMDLHLYARDLNYNHNLSISELEIYKFKKNLPSGGVFLDNVKDSNDLPVQPIIASGTYSGGPKIAEYFDAWGESNDGFASIMIPKLMTSGLPGEGSFDYYSTHLQYYTMNGNAAWVTNDDDWSYSDIEYFTSMHEGESVVVWKLIGDQIVPKNSRAGGMDANYFDLRLDSLIDDPEFSIWRYDWAQAVAHGKTDQFISQEVQRFTPSVGLEAQDAETDIGTEVPKHSLNTDNTFFDMVNYTKLRKDYTDLDDFYRPKITSLSTPHFTTHGSPSSGGAGYFLNVIKPSDDNSSPSKNMRFLGADKVGYNSMVVTKQIPKPLSMARKHGSSTDMNSMRIRMRVKIEHMSKMHKTGEQRSIGNNGNADVMTGNNLTRGMVVLLATRAPHESETMGVYLHRLNTGRCFNSWDYKTWDPETVHTISFYNRPRNKRDTDAWNVGEVTDRSRYNKYDATLVMDRTNNQFQAYMDDDGTTTTSYLVGQRELSRTNSYNGIAICRVPSGNPEDVTGTTATLHYGPQADYNYGGIGCDVLMHDANYNALAPSGRSHVKPSSVDDDEEGKFVMFHTGRSYGRYNHFDALYQLYTGSSDTYCSDFTPFIIKAGICSRRGDEYLGQRRNYDGLATGGGGNSGTGVHSYNIPVQEEFTVEGCTFTTDGVVITLPYHDSRIIPGMMVTGDNIPYKENGGATVLRVFRSSGTSGDYLLHLSDYQNTYANRIGSGIVSGTGSLTFKGGICPMGPNPEAFKPLQNNNAGTTLKKDEWFFIDAYINHNDNPDAYNGTGGNLTGDDGQQSTITWVISDSEENVLAKQTQCHSGAGGKTFATTTSAAGTSTTIGVDDLSAFSPGDCIAIDNDANSSTMERMIISEVDGSNAQRHNKTGAGNLTVVRGWQGDTIRSVADDKDIYHVPHSQSNMGDSFPGHLSIWINNAKIGLNEQTGDNHRAGETIGENGYYSECEISSTASVLLDYIDISNFQPKIKNTSPTKYQTTRGNLTITGSAEDKIIDPSLIEVGERLHTAEYVDSAGEREVTPTYLTWGTNSDIWTNKTNHIFLGGQNKENAQNFDPMDPEKRMNYTGSQEGDIRFFTFPSQSTTIVNSSTASDHTQYRMGMGMIRAGSYRGNRANNFNSSNNWSGYNTESVHLGTSTYNNNPDKPHMVDSFTKNGFFSIYSFWDFAADPDNDNTSAVDGKMIKTLNPLMSTKITKIVDAVTGKFEIVDAKALQGYEKDEFIIYRMGHRWNHGGHNHVSGHYYRRGLYIKSLNTETGDLVLKRSTSTYGIGRSVKNPKYSEYGSVLAHVDYLSDLYISPMKYWINCEIFHRNEELEEVLPNLTYSHSMICNNERSPDSATLGLTSDESIYSDTVSPSNRWNLSFNEKTSLVETQVDYGYGGWMDDEDFQTMDFESGSGYIQKQELVELENIFSLKGLAEKDKNRLVDSTEKVSLFLRASSETSGSGTILSTKYNEVGWRPSRIAPRLTYIYKDFLPTVTGFTVQPYEEDPFYPEYTWEAQDDDLWYGFLILDRESISNQYHKAALHIPMNEVPDLNYVYADGDVRHESGSETFAYPYISDSRDVWTAGVKGGGYGKGIVSSIEGLAGNCLLFDGEKVEGENYGQFLQYYYPVPATKHLSVIAHFRVGSLSKITSQTDGRATIISAPADNTSTQICYSMWVDDSGRVNASALTDDKTTNVVLTSKYVVPVGSDEPVCAILTVDTELSVGNIKLFINGKLEDQSGRKTTDGSSNNWKIGQIMEPLSFGGGATLHIGNQQTAVSPRANKNNFNGRLEEITVYNHTIYPVVPTDGSVVIYKPIEELTDSSDTAAGRPIVAKLFIKDYHNIRGTTPEEVTQTSQISIRKAGLGLKTSS